MSFQIAVDEPNHYIHLAVGGQIGGQEMTEVFAKLDEVLATASKDTPLNCLVDITRLDSVDSDARKVGIAHIDKLGFAKIAFVGKHSGVGAVAELITDTTGRGDKVKFFKDIPSARNWLAQTK